MRLILAILILSITGCISVGSQRLSVPTDVTVDDDDPRVILVLVDGLNHSTLKRYLKVLADSDHEPFWQSGLSLLARQDFKLANAQYPMAALPTFSPIADATIMTGHPPTKHGLISARFSRLPSTAPNQIIDLRSPEMKDQFLLSKNRGQSAPEGPAIGTSLLELEPWVAALHQHRATTSVFVPFGEGGTWYTPTRKKLLSQALFDNTVSKQTTLLLDQKVEEISEDEIAKGRHLTIIRFTGVRGHSCAPSSPGCRDASKNLNQRQQEALTRIDTRLWHLFRNFQMRHPEAFENTTFILSGTVGTTLRPPETQNNATFSVQVPELEAMLKKVEGHKCVTTKSTAGANEVDKPVGQRHRFSSDSGFGLLQMPHSVAGQVAQHDRDTHCLLTQFKAVVKQLDADGKLDAALWHTPGEPNPNIYFTEAFKRDSGSLERRRISDKLRTFTQASKNGKTVGAVFLRPPYIFSNSAQNRVHRGNLRRQTIRFPFLLADKHLSQTARRQMEGATIDHIDFGPTIFGLLSQDINSTLNFPRKPLLEFSEPDASNTRVLNYSRTYRTVYQPPAEKKPLSFIETGESLTVNYQEDRSIWPPDVLSVQLGPLTATWSIETQAFDHESCIYKHDKSGRTWRCTLPFPAATTPEAVLTRTPNVNGVGTLKSRTHFFRQPTSPTIVQAQQLCGDSGERTLRLDLNAKDGLNTISLQVKEQAQPQSPLTPFNALSLNAAQLIERICPKKVPSKDCRFNTQGELTGLKTTIALKDLYPDERAPVQLLACTQSGLCTRKSIESESLVCP